MGKSKSNTSADSGAPDAKSRVGSTVRGKWHIDKLIGVGGMAAVYAATHRNGQRVALKMLHAQLAGEGSIRDRFLREGYVTNSVGHSGCVSVLDDDETADGAPFLVMELLEGLTLSKRWKKLGKKMSIEEALQIADPMLDCLGACHDAGVIHRDLKPPNVFLTNKGEVKILDFGVAQLRDATTEKTRAGTALGTPYYMSPEQAMGLVDDLDGRADLFSVGAILHALITGKRIHTARTENEALILAATTPVPSVARTSQELPVDVVKLIDRSLAWDRRTRYKDARQMREDVQRVLGLLTGTTSPAAHVQVPRQWDPRAPQPERGPSALPPPPERGPSAPPPLPEPAKEQRAAAPVTDETASEDDPRVQHARDLFKHLERLFPTVRQLGWDHPATQRATQLAFEAFHRSLAEYPDAFALHVRPYSFLILGQTAWEPSAPFDSIPYNLFASGMRTIRVHPDIEQEEFVKFLTLLHADPGEDLPPEDDMVSAFWEAGFEHVSYETAEPFAVGAAGERERFVKEADELEHAAKESAERANRLEAEAMAIATDRHALSRAANAKSTLNLDPNVRAAYAKQLMLSSEEWSDRFVDALTDGILSSIQNGDKRRVFRSLQFSASDLVVAEKTDIAVSLYNAVAQQLERKAADSKIGRQLAVDLGGYMFGGDTLKLLVGRLAKQTGEASDFRQLILGLPPEELPVVLKLLAKLHPSEIRAILIAYLEKHTPGNEMRVVEAIPSLPSDVVIAIIDILARVKTDNATEALATISKGDDIGARVEARFHLSKSSSSLHADLDQLLADRNMGVRVATMRAIARHGEKDMLPALTRRVNASSFDDLMHNEKHSLLSSIIELAAARGEELALGIAQKGWLIRSDARESSRLAAIDALGDASRNPQVAAELQALSASRWGLTEKLREHAREAARRIAERQSTTGANT